MRRQDRRRASSHTHTLTHTHTHPHTHTPPRLWAQWYLEWWQSHRPTLLQQKIMMRLRDRGRVWIHLHTLYESPTPPPHTGKANTNITTICANNVKRYISIKYPTAAYHWNLCQTIKRYISIKCPITAYSMASHPLQGGLFERNGEISFHTQRYFHCHRNTFFPSVVWKNTTADESPLTGR